MTGMKENLSDLYQGVILEHNRTPLFFEKRPDARYVVEAYNPLCGDKFKLYLDVENGVIATATFHGYGCAVSKASSSVLMKKIQGVSLDDLPGILEEFLKAVAAGPENAPTVATDPETAAFTVAKKFPGRDKCAVLAWEALRNWTLEIGN
ncbi:MAG: SUF system NifU family Fe-S cluster assembly protein [Haliscomenobacteraceae bacterium CHB4]|nr:SUF system NifU family Fe-S cluster assembly protein [Haliscomenobacteraceae bacterium CHB4]